MSGLGTISTDILLLGLGLSLSGTIFHTSTVPKLFGKRTSASGEALVAIRLRLFYALPFA